MLNWKQEITHTLAIGELSGKPIRGHFRMGSVNACCYNENCNKKLCLHEQIDLTNSRELRQKSSKSPFNQKIMCIIRWYGRNAKKHTQSHVGKRGDGMCAIDYLDDISGNKRKEPWDIRMRTRLNLCSRDGRYHRPGTWKALRKFEPLYDVRWTMNLSCHVHATIIWAWLPRLCFLVHTDVGCIQIVGLDFTGLAKISSFPI